MLSLDTFKNTLGEKGKSLTDSEAEKLMLTQYKLANVLFDVWKRKTKIVVHEKNGNCIFISTFVEINFVFHHHSYA